MASEETPDRRAVTVRRAPKYVPFLIAGALVGAAAAAVIAYGMPADEGYNANAVFGFFLTFCAAGGAVLGAVVALLLDRRSVRRSKRAVVESVPDSVPDTDDDGRA